MLFNKGLIMGRGLLSRFLSGRLIPKRAMPNFAGMGLTKELSKVILRGPLKFIGLISLLNYTVI